MDGLFRLSCNTLKEAHRLHPEDPQILSEWADGLSEHATSKIRATSKTWKPLSPAERQEGFLYNSDHCLVLMFSKIH